MLMKEKEEKSAIYMYMAEKKSHLLKYNTDCLQKEMVVVY